MTHKLILKVKKFQPCSAKCFGTVEENVHGGGWGVVGVDSTPIPVRIKTGPFLCSNILSVCRHSFFALHKTSRTRKYNIQKGGVNR